MAQEYTLQQSPMRQTAKVSGNTVYDSWTPVLTCTTPGDLSVSYTTQSGVFFRIGSFVFMHFVITTSAFSHTTASGTIWLTGRPFPVDPKQTIASGPMQFEGITKANYTQFVPVVFAATPSNRIFFRCSGSGQPLDDLFIADLPTGGTVALTGSVCFMTAS